MRCALAEHDEALWDFDWRTFSARSVRENQDLAAECCDLYSSHYGVWSRDHPKHGQRVVMSRNRFEDLFSDDGSILACAYYEGQLVGYCTAVFTDTEITPTRIAWVSQLVVHTDFRHQRIATRLLFSVWQFSDCSAWGLVTSNPLAIRALEAATRRPVKRELVMAEGEGVLKVLDGRVPYLPSRLREAEDGSQEPLVFTEFFVSHDDVDELIKNAIRENRPWELGDIRGGYEWLACTFSDQSPDVLSDERLEEILVGADRTWIDAYSRMTLTEDHTWHQYAESEVDFVLSEISIAAGSRILDVGCGDGRHAIAFASRGLDVHAVEIVESLAEQARNSSVGESVEVERLDVRTSVPSGEHDAAVLLYDVLGSSPARDDNLRLLRHVVKSLKPGSPVVLSVMNASPTIRALPRERKPTTRGEFITALESLPATRAMESSGNVFDPAFILYFNEVFYRKEQFLGEGDFLPSEYVVRDSRFTRDGIRALCEKAGLEVESVRPVRLGRWADGTYMDEYDDRAKELLVVARTKASDQ